MKNKKYLILFLIILFLAAILRLYDLSNIPPGVNRDEASIGYTAYSLLETGKDEYGKFLPLSFQSFGDWKLPFYIYITSIFVKIFGLSELAVRLPSALFGIATVGLMFTLVKELFNKKLLSFLTMALIAISPWHIHLSRVGSESNTAVFFIVAGLILFLKSIKGKQWLIVPSFLFFSLTYYTYAGNHIFTTLFLAGLLILFRNKIPRNYFTYFSFFLFFSLSAIILYNTLFIADKTKISGVSLLSDPSIVHAKIELLRKEHDGSNSLIAKFLHNQFSFVIERFSQNYLNSFSPEFLFIRGGTNKAHNIENFGNMYIVESIFLLFGVSYLLILGKTKEEKLVLFWLLIAPLAASITKDAPHSTREFSIIPVLTLTIAIGINFFINKLKNYHSLKLLAFFSIPIFFIINFFVYIENYYIHFPRNETQNWGKSFKELNQILLQKQFENKKIIMSKPKESPYIFLLFYSQYDPSKFQKEVIRYDPTEDGFLHVNKYGRYEFRQIDWSKDINTPDRILIDSPTMISDFTRKQKYNTKEVVLPNGQVIFEILEIDNRRIMP